MNNVEKDVCEFYGISHEQYDIMVRGIGITNVLKNYGIEINETKLNDAGARRYKNEKE